MNKEITIYDLLGLIKDDKAPKKIKYNYVVYEYKEIPEEDKDIELLNLDTDKLKGKEVIRAIDYLLEGKINELIKEVNKLRSKEQ